MTPAERSLAIFGASVSETVAMSITGHETAAVFRRYSIVDTRDQVDALRAKEALAALQKPNLTH